MTTFNFLTDARLCNGAYDSNNKGNTPVIDGWKPVFVDLGQYKTALTFGAQMYECPDLMTSYTQIGGNHLGNKSDEIQTKSIRRKLQAASR